MSHLIDHALIRSYIKQNHFGELIGMEFSILNFGIVEYKMVIEQKHLATPYTAHGGVIASLLDATVGVGALSSVCEEGKVVSTIEMKVTFISPAKCGDILIGISEIVKKGKRIIFMEAKVTNQEGGLIAKASATMNVYPKEKAGY